MGANALIEYNRSMNIAIPEPVLGVTKSLERAGYPAYIVGGCVRDLLLGQTPKDWDVTTSATPEEIQKLFPETFYENDFGTVGVVTESTDETCKVVEVTPFRTEGAYTDARRPDSVSFGATLSEDLTRRDFTINALAYRPSTNELVDEHDGREDLNKKLIRAVGDAKKRFSEDALRMMRAIRLAAQLNFAIEQETATAIYENALKLKDISRERVRDELLKIIDTHSPMVAIDQARRLGLLAHIAPDLERGVGVRQNQAHSFDVYEHLLRSVQHAADKEWGRAVRVAALFHDISKPETRRWSDEKNDWTFHGHEVVGAKVTKNIMRDLKFPTDLAEKVVALVRWHMFFSDPDQITMSAVRRLIVNVGRENIWDLLNLRVCDRIGTGRPKEQPFRLRKYMAMVEQALLDPVSVGMLKLNGNELMKELAMEPGPRVGWTLHALLEVVLDDPSKNTREALIAVARTYTSLSNDDLRRRGEAGKAALQTIENDIIKDIEKKYHVSEA